jgi:hypothetical protein
MDENDSLLNYSLSNTGPTVNPGLNYSVKPQTSSFLKNGFGVDLQKDSNDFSGIGSIGTGPKTFLGLDQSTWGGLAAGGQLLGGLAGTMLAFDARDLARDTFNYNKMAGDRAYAMAKDAYDRNVRRADFIGNQMNRNATTVGQAQ